MNIVRATADWIANFSFELAAPFALVWRVYPGVSSERATRVQGINQRLRQPHEEVMASGTRTGHAAAEKASVADAPRMAA